MNTQARNQPQPFDTARSGRSDTRVETDTVPIPGPMFPAPAAAQFTAADRVDSWFSVATVLALIALAAYAAAGVAALYGPVFTQPLTGP